MAAYTFERGPKGLYEAQGLGWFKQVKWWSYDADVGVVGGERLRFTRLSWARGYHADGPTGIRIGDFLRESWIHGRGPVHWNDVTYEFGNESAWKGTFALSRYDERLALLGVKGFKQNVEITVPDGQAVPPAGLLVFCAWIAWVTARERSAASS